MLGFQSILKQSEAVEAERDAVGSVDVVQLVGCLYELLQQHRADIRGRDIMEDQYVTCRPSGRIQRSLIQSSFWKYITDQTVSCAMSIRFQRCQSDKEQLIVVRDRLKVKTVISYD